MVSSSHQPTRTPPVLACALTFGSLACAATSVGLGQFDLTGFVERRIVRAQGAVSVETAAWLQSRDWPGSILAIGFLLAGLGLIAFLRRPQIDRFTERFAGGMTGPAGLAAGVLLVVAWYFPTLRHGYFRYDDFELLAMALDQPFWTTLWQPHGDHILPLTRALAWLGLNLFGTTAWPYNLWLWLCLSGAVVMGMLVLAEMEAGRGAQWVFAVLVVFWSPWAELMAGYHILSTYLVIAVLGLGAAWFFLRRRRTGRARHAIGLALCSLLASLIDISGVYVFGVAAVFLGVDLGESHRTTGVGPWLVRHRWVLAGLLLAGSTSGGCLFYAYNVVNPGVFLSMGGGESRSLAQLTRDLVYLLGSGTLLSMATPFVYARLPGFLLGALTLGAGLLWLAGFVTVVRAATGPRRSMLGAMLLIVLGTGLMVVVGRTTPETWVVRWAAKHICPVYLWLCLLSAAGWDIAWRKLSGSRRQIFAECSIVVLTGFVAIQSVFGLLGMAVAFPPFGYPAEIRDAGRRRDAVETLRHDVVGRLVTQLGADAVVPTLDGNYLKARWPSLFSYNLSHYRAFFSDQAGQLKLVRNSAMQPWHTRAVHTVPVLRDAVSPALPRMLAGDPVLRALYFSPVALETRLLHGSKPEDSTRIESDGVTTLMLEDGSWDPESRPRLWLHADGLGASTTATVTFWSELLQSDWQGTVVLSSLPGHLTEVDLRQAYAFSLSPRVARLRIILPEPGRYRFQLAEAAP